MYVNIHTYMPLTEEIRLKIFGSPDLSVFLIDLLTGGDSIYSRENSFEMFGTPVKMRLMCTGNSEKSLDVLAIVIVLSPISSVCGFIIVFVHFVKQVAIVLHNILKIHTQCILSYKSL